jgi:Na+-transporting NADH:ubiquinone oxidoreductase subunit NqrB
MKFVTPLMIFALLALSGWADSLGFVYAPKIWHNGAVSWPNLAKSALCWGIGMSLYVIALRPMSTVGVTSAEMQTTVWFAMTIIGVVIFSGRFFNWPRLEQGVAVLVMVALGWLLVRTSD